MMSEPITAEQLATVNPDAPKHRPVVLLPKSISALAKLCAKEVGRYAMTGVRVISTEQGFRAEATNGRSLGIVTGPVEDAERYPALPQLAAAPNHETDTVIPAKSLVAACKAAPKRHNKPILQNCVAAVFGKETTEVGTAEKPEKKVEHVTTIASTDLESVNCAAYRQETTRFPNFADVMPKATAKSVSIDVNPEMLAELLRVAAEFTSEDTRRVTLTIHPERNECAVPMEVTTQENYHGQKFHGLLMPLS